MWLFTHTCEQLPFKQGMRFLWIWFKPLISLLLDMCQCPVSYCYLQTIMNDIYSYKSLGAYMINPSGKSLDVGLLSQREVN